MTRRNAVKRFGVLVFLVLLVAVLAPMSARAQDGTQRLSGSFSVAYEDYSALPMLVALSDASGYFSGEPIYLPPKEEQVLGTYTGNAGNGAYRIELPAQPKARPFDVTSGQLAQGGGLQIFDVRLMSDVAKRGYMVRNEDNIASSLRITIEFRIAGGRLIVWAADDKQQFPTGPGADAVLFTADDPRAPLPTGWSVVDLDAAPFAVNRAAAPTVNLITTGFGDTNDYTGLSCDVLIPTFLDRVQSVYPFTQLYDIDWAALRARLIPQAQAARTRQDCEKIIREFGNAIPDGHVNYLLPSLRAESAGSLGMILEPLTDGQIAVSLLREDGPAARAGIKPGAIITMWDGKPIDEALRQVVLQSSNGSTPHARLRLRLRDLTRGPLRSTVSVTFTNPGEQPQTATLTRDTPRQVRGRVNPPNVQDNRLPSGLGYIRIENFVGGNRLAEFDAAVTALIEQNVPGIIIDVRGNPGGFSQMSDAMASRFFTEPFLIGRTFSPDGRLVFQMQVEPRQPIYTAPVAVLVDSNTSSAGDLFAYTFKVSKRGLIVGSTPSSGMAGTVSGGQYFLPDGAFIQVPTGGLVDEAGKVIVEGTGVEPDVLVSVTVDSLLSNEDSVLAAAEAALLAVPVR